MELTSNLRDRSGLPVLSLERGSTIEGKDGLALVKESSLLWFLFVWAAKNLWALARNM